MITPIVKIAIGACGRAWRLVSNGPNVDEL